MADRRENGVAKSGGDSAPALQQRSQKYKKQPDKSPNKNDEIDKLRTAPLNGGIG